MNIRPRRKILACCISLACAAMAMQPAHADSAYGVDAIIGNAFNTGYAGGQRDPDATPSKHTPTGQLYGVPYARDEAVAGATSGWVEIGILSNGADEKAALFRKYKDPQGGLYLNSFGMTTESDNARFLDITGGGVGNNDQFYSLSVGRYNDWKVNAFYSETPHVFTSTYRNLWSGTGTANLTLNPPLVAGPVAPATAATTDIAIGNAALATPYSELSIIRKKGGVRADMNLQDNWKVFGSYSNEKRDGARPFGMVSAGGGGTGGVEIPESINYDTHDFLAGIQYSDELNSATLQASASLFRNNVGTMTVDNPMFLALPAGVTGIVGGFPRAVFDLYPDNDYYNFKGEYARELPDMMKGRFTGVVSLSQSKQNDNLIPSTPYAGAVVNTAAGGAWDTIASLSQPTANLKVDIKMADFGLSLKPVDDLDVKGKVRYYETQTNSNYQACNPLTGQYGRLINDGSGLAMFSALQANGLVLTAPQTAALNAFMAANGCNEAALASYLVANGLVPAAGNVNIRSVPYAYKQMNYTLGADYQLSQANSVNANYERETLNRAHRERAETWEDKIKLGYVNRGLENGTLRLSFENDRLRGTAYNPDPYDPFYSAALGSPNTGNLAMTSWIHVNSLHRKFDLADRDQNILNGRFNYMVRPDLDAGVSLQLKTAKYPDAVFGLDGRNKQEQNSLNFDLTWQPSSQMTLSGFYAYQDGRSEQNGIQQNACVVGTTYYFWSDGSVGVTAIPTAAQTAAGITLVGNSGIVTTANFASLCGTASATSPLYTTSRAWNVAQKNESDTLGLGFKFDFSSMTVLDMNYTYVSNRTKISYGYNPYALGILTSGAPTLAQLTTLGLIGNGFSDLVLTQNVVDASVLVPFTKESSVRVMGRFEVGKIRDWHYDGVAANPTPGVNQQTYLDSGPQHYRTYVLGVMYQYKM